ncbi:MAG: UDP-3-O-(3-hydroxymyristoyl)glucosamine N-acyltransferase [Myxococcota bacterium]|nr:UDP-3-O-(3-hydroxymyristoyl)glucosamine N-acyltransferase [Myxococcota bacterium]
MAGPFTVGEIARRLGGTVEGDSERCLSDVRGLQDAGPEHLSFLSNRRYVAKMRTSLAGAVLVDASTMAPEGRTVIRVADPYGAFAAAMVTFHPQTWPEPGVASGAAVHPSATVHATATIEAFAWVGPGAVVGAGSWVEAGVRVGAGSIVGSGCRLMANSVVCDGCVLGERVWLNPGAVVGSEGFGFAPTAQGNIKIPQVGRAVIEDDVELGANTCVDRAAMSETRIGRGSKLDNLVQVGHAAQIGEHALMVAYSGVAGSSRLGSRVTLAAKAAVLGHIELGDGVQVGVSSVVHSSIDAGEKVTGVPAIPHRKWLRSASSFGELPELLKTVRRLQERIAVLEGALEPTPPAKKNPADKTEALMSSSTEIPAEPPAEIDIQGILKLLPHRYPFLMIDRVLEVEAGVRAVGVKCVTANEPHFQGHFPDHPIMPGVLLSEAFAQLAGVIAMTAHPDFSGKAVYLIGLDKVRFRKPVLPGDRVLITCEKLFERRGVWKFSARAEVEGVRVADGQVMATVADKP